VVWTPSDGGLRKARVREAEADLVTAQATLDTVRLQVVADVSQAYLDLKTAEQRVVTAQAQVVNAEEALRLATGRYRSGIGVFIDVLDAQTSVDVAGTNLVNSQTAVDQARAAYARATGADLAQIPAP
jgi:outer membrane protein TolC